MNGITMKRAIAKNFDKGVTVVRDSGSIDFDLDFFFAI